MAIYLLRHATRTKDAFYRQDEETSLKVSAAAEFISTREKGRRVGLFSSPEQFAWGFAETLHKRIKETGLVQLTIPAGFVTGEPYTNHVAVDDMPFPFYGLSEYTADERYKFGVNPMEIKRLFPLFDGLFEAAQRDFAALDKPLFERIQAKDVSGDEKRRIGEERRELYKSALANLDKLQNPYCNINESPQPLLNLAYQGKSTFDSLVFVSHAGILSSAYRELVQPALLQRIGGKLPRISLKCLEGVVIDEEQGVVSNLGPRWAYGITAEPLP